MRHIQLEAKASRAGTGWGGDYPGVRIVIGEHELVMTERQASRLLDMLDRAVADCHRMNQGAL